MSIVTGEEAYTMLQNCSFLADVNEAECAVPADKEREMGIIGKENMPRLNLAVRGALAVGANAIILGTAEVNAVW